MGSDAGFAAFVVEQIDPELAVSYRRMFGEFGLYSDGRFFGLICDDQLFIKPTGADRLSRLVRITVRELFPED